MKHQNCSLKRCSYLVHRFHAGRYLGPGHAIFINPNVKYPYRAEIRSAGNVSSQDQLKIFISSLLCQNKLLQADEKYAVERTTVW